MNKLCKMGREFLVILILIFGIFAGAVLITALWVDDIDAKNTEPNEPEYSITGWITIPDPNEPVKVSLDFIPTWPDYIELEKDLVIDFIEPNSPYETKWDWIFPKGTKIYFND